MDNTTTVSATSQPATPEDATRTIEASLKHEPPKRKKTWGEHLFNWGTYGGVAMLGNEIASLAVTDSILPNKKFHNVYENKFVDKFRKLGEHTHVNGKQVLSEYIIGNPAKKQPFNGKSVTLRPRLPFLLVATIGGMFMVPFVKYLEDHKGSIVRKLDRKHYGDLGNADPKLIEAHKEMDEAPKQTWGSLGKGRFTTVVMAAVADATFGWDHSLTAKLFNSKSSGKEYSEVSLNGLARKTGNAVATLVTTKGWLKKDKFEVIKDVVDRSTWLVTLSSTLTVLFYASSKLFAKKQEEKKEEKQEQRFLRANGTYGDIAEDSTPMIQNEPLVNEKPSEKPSLQVKNVSRESTLATMPQLSQGA